MRAGSKKIYHLEALCVFFLTPISCASLDQLLTIDSVPLEQRRQDYVHAEGP